MVMKKKSIPTKNMSFTEAHSCVYNCLKQDNFNQKENDGYSRNRPRNPGPVFLLPVKKNR